VADESRMKDPLAAILKELRLVKREMTPNKSEFDQKLVDLTQEIRASTESDTASTARQTIVQPTEGIMAGAAVAQPVAEIPQTGVSGDSPGGNGANDPHSQMSAETVQGRIEMGTECQQFATLRPEAPNTFTGKPVELEDWLEAVHIYFGTSCAKGR
jgi:hypothetical protein